MATSARFVHHRHFINNEMKVFSTVAALAFLATAANALEIVSPTTGSTISNPITVQVDNSEGESFTTVQITFASACGSYTRTIPTGFAQTLYLPCEVNGLTNIVASYSSGQTASVQVSVNPSGPVPFGAEGCGYNIGCEIPCASPCFSPAALPPIQATGPVGCAQPCVNPCGRLSRRSRRSRCSNPCGHLPTATPCDTLYYNPPVNMPAPDCARHLRRCDRFYGEELPEQIQKFEASEQPVDNA